MNSLPGICPNCGGLIEIRNPTGKCDHLYWPDNLTPAARKKLKDAEAVLKAMGGRHG